jgi:hypothetical protein
MDSGIRPARGRYRYLAHITTAHRVRCRYHDAIAIPASLSSDFSQSAALIHRAEAATRLWLRTDGLHHLGAPPALLSHHHHND